MRALSSHEKAAILVENSLHGRAPAPLTEISLVARIVYHNTVYRTAYVIVAIALMILAIWEPPVAGYRQAWPALRAVDAAALLLFTFDSALQLAYFGWDLFLRKRCVAWLEAC